MNVGIIILDSSIAIALPDQKVGSQLSENSPSEDLPSQSNQEGIFQLVEAELQACAEKWTVLLSISLVWSAVAGCSRSETFSQLSAISFA